ncbi:MAG: dTDP-4-dehydrorhamnose 3,5-epimerase family protein [Polaromonas sp.]|uniref:dTDP-4-dehydrorhamnose 3,5-epimerase family protein n=1 Tax=Polaromonas sp. TaxID=1869339 RepID=UPI00248869BC|nr:dTDP-4-dehydrorhamnose 3,5-epimerase family protein [Polaromonas sp.]MDI1270372.1 dTDP-4-dehydrorhamnose 3,5-epimerase family protein [Polaromonas sp.]
MAAANQNPITSAIMGVTLAGLRQITDERGAVLHMLRSDAPDFTRFGECYFSEVQPGAVKAWKRHRMQTQVLAVPVGRIRMVMYDDRAESTTKGQLQELELGRPDAYLRLRIPPGVWYGFGCLGATPALLVNCADSPHDPHESEVCPLNDPVIPYRWDGRTP